MIPNSTQIYDRFAPHYRHYSEQKSRYLSAIDTLILKNIEHPKIVLDIGCGDGVRGARLANKMSPDEFVMIDNSTKMVELANKFRSPIINIIKADIINNKFTKNRLNHFDAVLCLWNVFGHITAPHQRLDTLLNIRDVMKEDGVLCIDVSNRYNISHYGLKSVLKNIWQDITRPDQDNGIFSYEIDVGTEKIPSHCHFFSPREFPKLCNKAGLNIEKTFYVNYKTGNITNRFGGHALYFVKKKTPR